MRRVCVIGGGAAGMMAAYAAAQNDGAVTLIEKNEKLGKKIYITGKGRCNVTNAADIADFFENAVRNPSFLYSALYTFNNDQLMTFLEAHGTPVKTERGGRVFPVSERASDVTAALEKAMRGAGAHIELNTAVEKLQIEDGRVTGVMIGGKPRTYDAVVVATGGASYPSTGSAGDGYSFARQAGHRIIPPQASLVGVDTCEDVSAMAGLTLKNVTLTLKRENKAVFSQQGEMLLTHTGLSGPLVLSASAYMEDGPYTAHIDLKPALDAQRLDERLLRDFAERANQNFSNVLGGLVPSALIEVMLEKTGIPAETKAHSITKQQRAKLRDTLKNLTFEIAGKRPLKEAVITRGGVDVKEIDASTMQSKLCAGLFFAGEVIDVDALTGGYNLQIAFSTGYLAGSRCADGES